MLSQRILDAMVKYVNIPNLDVFSIEEFVTAVEACQLRVMEEFGLSNIEVRRLDPHTIEALLARIKDGHGIQLILRHGEQDPGFAIATLEGELRKKTIMMQKLHNENDPITVSSAIEYMGTLMTISYLMAKTGYKVEVEHSPNLRAKQPAEALAKTLKLPITPSPALQCVNYKEDDELDIGQLDPQGNLAWDEPHVGAVVGSGVFEQIGKDMRDRLAQPLKPKTIEVIITHTQHIDELHIQASVSKEPAGRLSNYGFVYRDAGGMVRHADGLYSKDKVMLAATKQSERASSARFFAAEPAPVMTNIGALKTAGLGLYISQIPTFPEILARLQQELGFFEGKPAVSYSMQNFLDDYFKSSMPDLGKTPFQLLAEPLSPPVDGDDPQPLDRSLSGEVECYVDVLIDVLRNKLAQKPYEVGHQENVTENEHALQAGKISERIGMHADDVLGLLFHDIARPSVGDPDYGHSHHCQEGSEILAPLGLSTGYSRYHAFAKRLLYKFCIPSYGSLISPTSEMTLETQQKDLAREASELGKLEPLELAFTIYKLMFMRLIDDMSKVPTSELTKELGKKPEYFSDLYIRDMLMKQIIKLLKQGTTSFAEIKERLDPALRLLLRAKVHTADPVVYEKHSHIIDPLLGVACGVSP